jgi:hypothetical protein
VVVWLRLVPGASLFAALPWPEVLLLALATLATLMNLAAQLPSQNVLLAAFIAGAIGGGFQALAALTGIPFATLGLPEQVSEADSSAMFWVAPFAWIVLVFNSRGAARLVLQRWRHIRFYGLWVIGLAAVLAVGLSAGPASLAPHGGGPRNLAMFSLNLLGFALASVVILALATPALINKKPVPAGPAPAQPLVIWVTLTILVVSAAITHRH